MSDSFFTIGAETRLGENNHLLKLNDLIDYNRIRRKLKGLHKNEVDSKEGNYGLISKIIIQKHSENIEQKKNNRLCRSRYVKIMTS